MGGDWRDALLYLRGSGMRDDPNYINSLENDYIKALMIEPEMIKDPYVQNRIRYFIKKRISQAKTGVVKVRGNFQVASGDPYALCQSIFGMEVTGLLKAGEVYSRFWNDRDVKRVACFRAPMSCHNNIVLRNLNSNDDCKNWYRYIKTVTILSAWDNTCAALNGADFDSGATLLKNAGMSLEDVSSLLNHAGTDVTNKYYIKKDTTKIQSAKDRFEI